jgi:ribonuclease G
MSERLEIILNCEKLEKRFALLTNKKLTEYQIEREDDTPKAGNIYLGKITNMDTLLQAAFVDIGAQRNAFLHFNEMLPGYNDLAQEYNPQSASFETVALPPNKKRHPHKGKNSNLPLRFNNSHVSVKDVPNIFKVGMEIMVQVTKSQISTKGAKTSTDISIPGRYLVLMPYNPTIGLSTRIEDKEERNRLKEILANLEIPEGMGVICRTASEGRKANLIQNDLNLLLDYWKKIEKKLETAKAPQLLFSEPNLIERTIRDFMTDEINGNIVVDDVDVRQHIADTLRRAGAPKLARKVVYYSLSTPIFDYYPVNDQLSQVFKREVTLPSGGAIIIDETEALISIDVNTGKSRTGLDQNELILKTNLEAAEEIARQLRLRDIGGLVVIDFIDMRLSKHKDEVYRAMKKFLKDDKAKTTILPLSKFCLMEMTRQREHDSIRHQVYIPCPYCTGTGLVKSALTISAEIQRKLNAILKDKKYHNVKKLRVYMHPDILERMRKEDTKILDDLERKFKQELSFRTNPELHYEEFKIFDLESEMEISL